MKTMHMIGQINISHRQIINLLYCYQISMDIGSSIAVFISLCMMLLALFCFVTKHLHNRMKRGFQDKNEVYSIQDQLYDSSQEDVDFDRSSYNAKYTSIKNRSGSKKHLQMDEVDSYRSRLKGYDDQIYKPNIIRDKFSTSTLQLDNKQQTSRSMASQKSFRPQKMISQRVKDQPIKAFQDTIKHTYISRLIKYDTTGLVVWHITLKMVRKSKDGNIQQNKTANLYPFISTDQMFGLELQNLGIDLGSFGCYIYQSTIQLEDRTEEAIYTVGDLKISQSRRQISQFEFEKYKEKIKIECTPQ